MRAGTWAVVVTAVSVMGCGGGEQALDATVATVAPVRGAVTIGETPAAVVARAAAGDAVATPEGGLARLRLDQGPRLLLDEATAVEVTDGSSLRISAGRAFVEVLSGEQIEIRTEQGSLRASNAAFSVRVGDGATRAYVVRGELSWTRAEERGIASSGESLTLDAERASREPATLWDDWTGGLARTGPSGSAGPRGVGTLEARVPDEVGRARWPLVIRRLDVRVRIDRDLAITEVDQLFFNPASVAVEGLYRIRVPEGAVLQRFAVDRDDRLVDGYVREKAQARAAYEAQVYRGSTEDPALLEWDAPGSYRARIYPIAPGSTRRIVIRYAQWLRPPAGGESRLYRYPMGGARPPHIQEFALAVDVAEAGAQRVRAGMDATVEDGAVRIRRSDFRPRSDFWLELVDAAGDDPTQRAWTAPHEPPPRAPDAREIPNEADERDYFYLPLVLPTSLNHAEPGPIDLVILADVSAATDRTHLELGRSVVESLTSHLGADDRVAIVTSDLTIRSVLDGESPELGDTGHARVEALLDGLARVPAGGATDLGEAIAAAAALLDPTRRGAIVYVGDGAPTVGELRAEGLLERLARLPEPARLYAVAVGGDANLELLEALTRGGGLALRVEERADAADAAMRVLAHALRPVAHQITVDLGTGIENSFPRRPMDAVLGEVFPVTGRVRDELPAEVVVHGTIDGEEFSETIPITTETTQESTDLRLRWAGERLRELLLTGAGREEVAELGTRYGLITPFTSYYVPSRRELSQMGPHARNWIDQPLLPVGGHRSTGEELARGAMTLALGPLSIAGCADREPEQSAEEEMPYAPASAELAEAPRDDDEGGGGRHAAADEEGEMGAQEAPDDNGRYAIQGPAGGAAERGREQAPAQPSADSTAIDGLGARAPEAEPTPSAAADPFEALGALQGDDVGDNAGFGGLGMRGTGRGGGGAESGTIGLGNLGTIGHADGSGSGYGRGAGPGARRGAATPRIRTGNASVRGSLSREIVRRVVRRHLNEVRFCYEQQLAREPDLEGRVQIAFVVSATGAVQSSVVSASTLGSPVVEGCIAQGVRRWGFPAPPDGGVVAVNYPFVLSSSDGYVRRPPSRPEPEPEARVVVTRIVSHTRPIDHRRLTCSDAARLRLSDRRALWVERLHAEPSAAGWVRLYREAIRNCEARSWRARRAFLTAILNRAGSIPAMTQVYSLLSGAAERTFVRTRILRRVRSPQDLRTARAAFGLGREVDHALVAQIMEHASGAAAKIRAMRRLTMQFPDSSELKLRLLALLERADHGAEAKRLADRLRADPSSDPGVRTAVGEMLLRMGREDDARRAFSEIVEFAPLDELARRRLGDLYRAHGWYEDAYRQYQTLREIRPDDPSVQLLLAQAAAGAGRVDEALRLERGLMQTSEPGASTGVARTALLWSSVRFARLREAARQAGDDERLAELSHRMRRSGVLREAGALRATLVWSHPDAQISLWVGLPGLSPSRPRDLTPEYGLEAFDLEEQEDEPYRLEVRRTSDDEDLSEVSAQLVVVWNEGQEDEQVRIMDLTFDREHTLAAWTVRGRTLTEVEQ